MTYRYEGFLFVTANSAAAGTGGIWFLSYLPYAFIQPRYETMTRGSKMGTCLLHNIGLALGAQLIGMFEGKGIYIKLINVEFNYKFRYRSSMVNV
jgi:ATP-binding cassette subfamily A (ABC1) protein 3